MKDELLPYYERELTFVRQMAQEFAAKYPEKASRLQLEPHKCEDPHVERLIEAFALLAGRISHKIDDEFPEITESLLGILYPHYIRPIPSMSISQIESDPDQSEATAGLTLKEHSQIDSRPVGGLRCRFRTCYPVTLWPLEVSSAAVVRPSVMPPLSSGSSLDFGQAAAALRIEIRCLGGTRLAQMPFASLRFFLAGEGQITHTLYELIFNNAYGVVLRNPQKGSRAQPVALREPFLREVGFGRQEGMLPYSDLSFLGYRLLQEYFTFPEKFLFFELCGFDGALRASFDDRIEILILLREFERKERLAQLEQAVNRETFRLGCTPIINLFEKSAQPIRVSHAKTEYCVIPDEHYQMAMEVYSVDRVASATSYSQETKEYEPIYSFRHTNQGEPGQTFWYAGRRPSHRKGDPGTEVYLTLVDLGFRPNAPPSEALTVHITCTNRDLPGKLPFTGEWGEFDVETSPSVRVRCLRKPTETVRPALRRGLQWRLISHLALNHLSIVDGGVDALQEILKLYDLSNDPVIRRKIAGITRVSSRPHMARLTSENGVVFAVGTGVDLEFDEEQFAGSGVFLMAAVLERFFGLYSSINSFSQLTAATRQRRGILKQWEPRAGEQILL